MNIGVEITYLNSHLTIIGREIFRHALSKRGDQDPLPTRRPLPDLSEKIIDLALDGLDNDFRIHESRGPDDLLHDLSRGFRQFVSRRSSGDIKALLGKGLVFFKTEGTVVQGRRKSESIFHQGLLPGTVPTIHAD